MYSAALNRIERESHVLISSWLLGQASRRGLISCIGRFSHAIGQKAHPRNPAGYMAASTAPRADAWGERPIRRACSGSTYVFVRFRKYPDSAAGPSRIAGHFFGGIGTVRAYMLWSRIASPSPQSEPILDHGRSRIQKSCKPDRHRTGLSM